MSPLRQLAAAAALLPVLAACSGGSPAADLQSRMNDVTDAANSQDAAALRTAVGRFEELVAAESQNGDITATRSQALRALAEQVLLDASLLDRPAPSPTPSAPPATSPAPATSSPPPPPPTSASASPSPARSSASASSPSPVLPGLSVSPSAAASP